MQCVLIVNTCLKIKEKLWIVDVNLSVRLSTYCQNMVNIYSSVITSNSKSLPKLLHQKKIQIRHFKTVIPSLSALRKITGGENTF